MISFSAMQCISSPILTHVPFLTVFTLFMVFVLHLERKILSTHLLAKVWRDRHLHASRGLLQEGRNDWLPRLVFFFFIFSICCWYFTKSMHYFRKKFKNIEYDIKSLSPQIKHSCVSAPFCSLYSEATDTTEPSIRKAINCGQLESLYFKSHYHQEFWERCVCVASKMWF